MPNTNTASHMKHLVFRKLSLLFKDFKEKKAFTLLFYKAYRHMIYYHAGLMYHVSDKNVWLCEKRELLDNDSMFWLVRVGDLEYSFFSEEQADKFIEKLSIPIFFTAELHVKPQGHEDWKIVSQSDDPLRVRHVSIAREGQSLVCRIKFAQNENFIQTVYTDINNLKMNVWNCIKIEMSANQSSIYIDGWEVASVRTSPLPWHALPQSAYNSFVSYEPVVKGQRKIRFDNLGVSVNSNQHNHMVMP